MLIRLQGFNRVNVFNAGSNLTFTQRGGSFHVAVGCQLRDVARISSVTAHALMLLSGMLLLGGILGSRLLHMGSKLLLLLHDVFEGVGLAL
jgi:hypothetical protein